MAENKEQDTQAAVDEEVLRLLQAHDPTAAERLLQVFGDRVYGLSLRILGNEQDAQEAVQETFLTVWRKWPTFKQEAKFSSWIYRIAANQAFMKLRKNKRHRGQVSMDQLREAGTLDPAIHNCEDDQLSGSNVKPPDEVLNCRDVNGLIMWAIDALAPIYRTAYMLKDIDGLSLKEIAAVMDISEPAAKSRVHRARLELRQKLAPFLD